MAYVIDYNKIPKIELDILSRALLTAVERFYSDPDNLRRFEEWEESEEGRAMIRRICADDSPMN